MIIIIIICVFFYIYGFMQIAVTSVLMQWRYYSLTLSQESCTNLFTILPIDWLLFMNTMCLIVSLLFNYHVYHHIMDCFYIDGLVQDFSISSANELEILQSCTKPPVWFTSSVTLLQHQWIRLWYLQCTRPSSYFASLKWKIKDSHITEKFM